MADPTVVDAGVDIAKVGGGGGAGMILMAVLQRFFNKSDKDEATNAQILAAVNALGNKLDVLHERQTTTRADVDKLEAGLLSLQLQVANLAGEFKHLSENLAR